MSEVTQNNEPSGEVVVFEAPDGGPRVEVVVGDETVWLTSRQMSELFQTTTRNVELHAGNAYAEGELDEGTTAKESFVVRSEGDRQVRRRIRHYNLDMVISVGYRVKSRRGTQFRIWANGVLRDHLLRGYTLNEKRLLARGVEFDQAVALLTTTLRNQQLVTWGGEALYPTIESRATHLLYFVIKNHPLTDGNKRTGSLLFLDYLRRNNALAGSTGQPRFSDTALVALALLVAESEASHKDLVIRLILNLLAEDRP